jgi:hypothetical protein
VQEAVRVGRAEEADEGLGLVPRQGVADKGHMLSAHGREERLGIERRQRAPIRLPPPVEVARVRPPVADAVVALLHVAQRAIVPDAVARSVHPLPLRVVAAPPFSRSATNESRPTVATTACDEMKKTKKVESF